jgi:hypothetical protein
MGQDFRIGNQARAIEKLKFVPRDKTQHFQGMESLAALQACFGGVPGQFR